jgi:single-strand DNA-binding protein
MNQVKGTVNHVELIGWLGGDPEQRFLPSGVSVCSFRVATKRYSGRNEAGERTVETDWTPVEVWDRLAEQCASMLHKGSRVRVIGGLITQSWEDRETKQRRYKTFVRAESVLFLDARAEAQQVDEETTEASVAELVEDLPF